MEVVAPLPPQPQDGRHLKDNPPLANAPDVLHVAPTALTINFSSLMRKAARIDARTCSKCKHAIPDPAWQWKQCPRCRTAQKQRNAEQAVARRTGQDAFNSHKQHKQQRVSQAVSDLLVLSLILRRVIGALYTYRFWAIS